MLIKIDFQSDEALYIQLRNQIILGIATSTLHEGDVLPSVRQLAEEYRDKALLDNDYASHSYAQDMEQEHLYAEARKRLK